MYVNKELYNFNTKRNPCQIKTKVMFIKMFNTNCIISDEYLSINDLTFYLRCLPPKSGRPTKTGYQPKSEADIKIHKMSSSSSNIEKSNT